VYWLKIILTLYMVIVLSIEINMDDLIWTTELSANKSK